MDADKKHVEALLTNAYEQCMDLARRIDIVLHSGDLSESMRGALAGQLIAPTWAIETSLRDALRGRP